MVHTAQNPKGGSGDSFASPSNPAWSGPSPHQVPDYGTLYAFECAPGCWQLCCSPDGRHYAMTLFSREPLDEEIWAGRRWTVKRMGRLADIVAGQLKASVEAG